jgi:hypothetical protein
MTRRSIGELADVTNAYRSREPFQQIIWRQHAEVEARQQGKRHRESGFLSLIEAASQITEEFSAACSQRCKGSRRSAAKIRLTLTSRIIRTCTDCALPPTSFEPR